jgi:hypothetical protein
MNLASTRLFWRVLAPAAVLLLAAWWQTGALARREAALAAQVGSLRAELSRGGFEFDAAAIAARRDQAVKEAETLRYFTEFSHRLAADPLMLHSAGRPFQLIEFERERAAIAQDLRERATAAKVKLDASAFEVLADNSESPAQPRRRWAQLALAREVADRAVAARVGSYEALPVPAVRELRAAKSTPVLADQILFAARVTGESASVQAFVEYLALGVEPDDPRLLVEHLVLRKDGISAPDQASATVVVAGLLPPAETPPAAP